MSSHSQWDSQWFYLNNDEGFFPPYTRGVITACPEHWKYGVVAEHQPRLWPLPDAMRRLHEEGLTTTIIFSAIHHRRVLPLMAHPLRLDEMGLEAAPEDLKRSRMLKEVLSDEEIILRVKGVFPTLSWLRESTSFL